MLRKKLLLKSLNIRGDTIIEVMLVLAILGLALSISYSAASTSLLAARQAQESSQAASLMQSQIELLQANRKQVDSTQPNYIYQAGSFCMNPDPAANAVQSFASGCDFNNDGSALEPAGRYNVRIDQTVANTFRLVVSWDDVAGNEENTATFFYRIYPNS